MSRFLKILLYAVVLFGIFLWISSCYKSCNTAKQTTSQKSVASDDEEYYDTGDFFEEGDGTETYDSSTASDNIDYTEVDKVVEDNLRESDDPLSSTTPEKIVAIDEPSTPIETKSVDTGDSNGRYMVIAGSYLIQDNAERMQRRLRALGYDNASIVVFDLSQYHSVIASRFNDYNKALRVSNELKRRGIDCYVHAQQK